MAGNNTEQIANPPISSSSSIEDKQARLTDLTARAAAKDAIKDYHTATELYSQATELQAELNGELSVDNADLLYAYGKSLYNVAVSKSDVLGTKVAGDAQPPSKDATTTTTGGARNANSTGSTSAGEDLIKNAMSRDVPKKSSLVGEQTELAAAAPLFRFEGDENFADAGSDAEDEEGDGGAGGEDEEEDDFANAFEVLDLARVLYLKKLEAAEEAPEKGKTAEMTFEMKHVKERLADTYDLQAEISLEAERFGDAVADLQTALSLRQALYPIEDPAMAECHYKLSLALEFASVNKYEEGNDGGKTDVDQGMRDMAITHMERAIESCKIRMRLEQKQLEDTPDMDEDKAAATKRKVANVKEIIADMEQRLIDLRRPAVSAKEVEQSNEAFLKGILGQIAGQSPAEQKARLDAATKGATDVSAFVRKKTTKSQTTEQGYERNKRPMVSAENSDSSKRAKLEEASF